ncbi:MAG: Holliday junction branch migration protein RuvA [Bacteroidales bacterium]|nr:Holliday junction branch migration protein RuvA [Bacteroidales bacterium]
MYSYIKGKLIEKNPTYVVIESAGIGYYINISLHTFSKISDDEQCKLFIHFVVREDAQILYGFADKEERKLFRHLISVSGVGSNTARLILSSLKTEEIFDAIINNKPSVLQSVKGIGGKTAQRIIIDLKDKLDKEGISVENLNIPHNTQKDEALSGLVSLGFNKKVAEKAIDKILKSGDSALSVEQLIKNALKTL